jgi:hypothetical protein
MRRAKDMRIQGTAKKAGQRSFDITSTAWVFLGQNQSDQQVERSALVRLGTKRGMPSFSK